MVDHFPDRWIIIIRAAGSIFAGLVGLLSRSLQLGMGALFAGLGGIAWAVDPGMDGIGALAPAGFVVGGICGVIGLMLGVVELLGEAEAPSDGLFLAKAEGEASTSDLSLVSHNGYGSLKEKDSIFNHLLFGTDGKNTYLGVRFSW